MAHEAHNFDINVLFFGGINECSATVDIVSAKSIDEGSDGLESPFVKNKVSGENVDWEY